MPIPYTLALSTIEDVANQCASCFADDVERLPLQSALGRICASTYTSPEESPSFDTSAMDGFAVNADLTAQASQANPITLCVQGLIAAGDEPLVTSGEQEDGYIPCVEIMTGAPFPETKTPALPFDSCVRYEDTVPSKGPRLGQRYVQITKPAKKNQNRRFAGADFKTGDVIASKGTRIRAQHIMGLALLGINSLSVFRKPRVAVFSTGSELLSYESECTNSRSQIRDSNGPYIQTLLTELGVDVKYFGIIRDDVEEFYTAIRKTLAKISYDAIITTGAVSMGKFDFVPKGLEGLGANIRFHKVAIRPGHPVLFASLPQPRHEHPHGSSHTESVTKGASPTEHREVPFFGLPGNPMATVVCLRFLVIPYLRFLHGQARETASQARLALSTSNPVSADSPQLATEVLRKPEHVQMFCHGKESPTISGRDFKVNADQGSSKIKPLLGANAWIALPQGEGDIRAGTIVESYPLVPPSLGYDDE